MFLLLEIIDFAYIIIISLFTRFVKEFEIFLKK